MICPAAYSLVQIVGAFALGLIAWALVRAVSDVVESFREPR